MDAPTSFLDLSEKDFVAKLKAKSSWKERSERTLLEVHRPELHKRLELDFEIPTYSSASNQQSDARVDPFAPIKDLSNKSCIEIVYLGNSMLERLKTTGASTNLARIAKESTAWNAGCGGDKNENVIYRLVDDNNGVYHTLKAFSDVKLWVLVSGTNNLRKKPFRPSDVESYRLLLEACLWIAPKSKIIACDMFYRKDIPDAVVDESNTMLESVVQEINQELFGREEAQEIQWVEARSLIRKDMLVDNVHLTEEGYVKWDEVLWPYVREFMESSKTEGRGEGEKNSDEEFIVE